MCLNNIFISMFKLECLQIYQNMRIIYIATSCVSFHSYLCTCIAFPLSHINNPSLVNQSVKLLTVGPRIFSHHFLSSAWRRTSLVEWLPLSSSELQCCWRGQTGRWAGSPSAAAGPYRPALSPGRAGKSTVPAALSYSSRCCQTEWPDCNWRKNRSKIDEGHVMTYMHIKSV